MTKKALIIGRNHHLTWAIPPLLHRAGFVSHLVTSSKLMKKSRFIQKYHFIAPHHSFIPLLSTKIKEGYDWIIVTEDGVLAEIAESPLPMEEKIKLLPILREENLVHLYSKIGLSHTLAKHGIKTPPFLVATGVDAVLKGAEKLGYPLLLKLDASGGGQGVYECSHPNEITRLNYTLFHKPLLVQKKIVGYELDLSALFCNGKLIHFSYAKVVKCSTRFGPSFLRTYTPLCHVERALFTELEQVGEALGANGFTNISAIQAPEGRYFFEVDMRPNVWVDTPRFWGEDPALRIAHWFSEGKTLTCPTPGEHPPNITIPYFLRLPTYHLLINRYQVWKFIPKEDPLLLLKIIFDNLCCWNVRHYFFVTVKFIIPNRFHNKLRVFRNKLCRKSVIC